MTRDVRSLGRNDRLSLADEVMGLERFRHMPVVDEEGTLVGIVSQRDLFRGALARALGYGQHAQDRLIAQLLVKEVMTNDPVSVAPDASVDQAAQSMLEHKVGCLPVVEDGRLVGILTESDLLRHLTGGR
jgi:CBS domain-containing protein